MCHDLINENPNYPFTKQEPERQWKVHSCFEPCKQSATVLEEGFGKDGRDVCKNEERDNGLLCVDPRETCEIYTNESQICFDENFEICIDYMIILYAVIICCSLQTIFDASLLFSFQVTFKPTKLEVMFDPDLQDDAD